MSRILSLLCVLLATTALQAQAPAEPLVKRVKVSLAKGVDYLISQQANNGGWATTVDDDKTDFSGGSTGLAVLALLNCGDIFHDDPKLEQRRKTAIEKGLKNLRGLTPRTTYVRALQTMAFAEAKTDLAIIKANVDWLVEARAFRKGEFIGWDYHSRPNAPATDASNSQYAMLALWYARQVGVEVKSEVWQSIYSYYKGTQQGSGAWGYSAYYDGMNKPSMTMTVAGMCGLLIAGMELNGDREEWLPRGGVKNCGDYKENPAIANALRWINKNFTLEVPDRTFYHLYGLERAGRLSGMRFFGEHDWYREGCEYLVKTQEGSGAWGKRAVYDRWPHVNTSFALLFLSKGRTPVLVSKLVHGAWSRTGRNEQDLDWNNDRNDLRHLTEYLSRTPLFGKKALAWQTYDIRRSAEAFLVKGNTLTEDDEAAIVADMLQSPVLYITGHQSPADRLQPMEKKLIKRFVDNGGFIIAEACCGRKEFDLGIKALVRDIWEESELKYVEPTHPVWTCWETVKPGDPFQLMSLEVGCRTVMFYSPQDLSCYWESNRTKGGVSQRAFELGANMIAYATGKTPPLPRLTPIEIVSAAAPKELRAGGLLHIGQIYHGGDWQPAPKAMTNLLQHVHKVAGFGAALKTERVMLDGGSINSRIKLLYLHGRNDFKIDAGKLDPLRFTLESGGLLFADACCGSEAFDQAFRKLVQDLYPKEKLVRVSGEAGKRDRLFQLGGKELTAANIECRTKANQPMTPMEPFLEGIQIDGRWVVLYSKYDIGCALERSTSAYCLGYSHDSALKIATAVVLYHAQP